MVSRQLIVIHSVVVVSLFFFVPSAFAQYYGYYPPATRMFSVNGVGGSYGYSYPMMNRGYYPPSPYYPTNRPHTVDLDQYHHIQYNQPGRVGMPTIPKYYNSNPNPRSLAWRNHK